MNLFFDGFAKVGLKIDTDKAMVMNQQPLNAECAVPRIHVHETGLKTVDNVTYFGNTISRRIRIDDEVAHLNSKASQALGRLQNSV
nr:unnamed protein product [Spirometra erinaceieuropaei]